MKTLEINLYFMAINLFRCYPFLTFLIIFLKGLNVAIEDSLGKNVLWLFATHIGITGLL